MKKKPPMIKLCCPGCSNDSSVEIARNKRTALNDRKVVLRCSCGTEWSEYEEDIKDVERA